MRMLSDPRIRKGKIAQRGSNKRKMETDEERGGDQALGQHGAQAVYSCSLSVASWAPDDTLWTIYK